MLSRALFFPTLGFNVMMERLSFRDWYNRVDENVVLGALPFRSQTKELVEKENIGAVISMNEDFELRHFVNTEQEWNEIGVAYLRLPTVDLVATPTEQQLQRGVDFMLDQKSKDRSVYVHCKAGRTRSATLVGCYLCVVYGYSAKEALEHMQKVRPQVWLRQQHIQSIKAFQSI